MNAMKIAAAKTVSSRTLFKDTLSKDICSGAFLVALALVFIISSSALAEDAENAETAETAGNYVNWGKKYYITIPGDWRQIERSNVESFLQLHGKNPEEVDFDIFLCPKDASPFYSQAYVFISAEQLANSVSFADSIYAGMGREFDKLINEAADAGPISRMKSRVPVYDKSTQTITQVSELNTQGQNQIMTLVMKFYDYGIATFYYYTTADKYEGFKDKFKEISDSFSGEDLEEAAGVDKPNIVDVSDINAQTNTSEAVQIAEEDPGESKVIFPLAITISLAMVALVVIRKRRQRLAK